MLIEKRIKTTVILENKILFDKILKKYEVQHIFFMLKILGNLGMGESLANVIKAISVNL